MLPRWRVSLLSILIPHGIMGNIIWSTKHSLARLNTTGRSSGIPEGAVKDRLTRCHSSLRHGTQTLGLGGLFFKVYSFGLLCPARQGHCSQDVALQHARMILWWREAVIRAYRPRRIARALLRPPVSPLGNTVTPVRPGRLPLTPNVFICFCKIFS